MKDIQWFKTEVAPKLTNFILKYVEGEGDFGELNGVQFDSEELGGYIYFWEYGYIGLQLVNYKTDEELVEDSLLEIESENSEVEEKLKSIIGYIIAP